MKKAYRQLILRVHPDKNPSPEAAAKFNSISIFDTIRPSIVGEYVKTRMRTAAALE